MPSASAIAAASIVGARLPRRRLARRAARALNSGVFDDGGIDARYEPLDVPLMTLGETIELLRGDGVSVVEKTLRYHDFQTADEIFSSGNFAKVAPIIRIDDRSLHPGPFYSRARKLYWEFAHG